MRIGLFATCLADLMRPSIALAALDLLERDGRLVIVPPNQTCCGQPAYNGGERVLAQRLALKVMAEFADCDYIVVPSGSCAGMMKVHYPELLKEFPEHAVAISAFAGKVYELSDFLLNVLHFQAEGHLPVTACYHDSCSGLRELGVKQQPRQLLAGIEGLALREMEGAEQCCGFGGAFAVKFGELSTELADRKCQGIESCGVEMLIGGDLGCLLQLEGRLRRLGKSTKVMHFAEILAGNQDESNA
ncbi:(Fe-S)-binding protein [Parachitinimonas caeni]|uniref:(Fe-S)-binding protein n=1 Tax=Parachitinimonas caeni TaxID=3031301 RepID=A0ABT7E1G0_9NEIS|nr:(Fe-S)-binding protein [Parachitinimonas caeni]MDK2126131.1 (Fe-S)-binding protein [Parachitinimonas caeni]